MDGIRASLQYSFVDRYGNILINFAAVVVLSRLLAPAETGLYSVAAALINIAQSIREFGVSNYILQERDQTRERIALATGISVLMGGLLAVIFILCASPIASFYGDPRLAPIVQVLSLNFIVVGFAAITAARLQRDMRFRSFMYVSICGNLTNGVVAIVVAALGYGAISLAWGSLAGVVVTLTGHYIILGRDGMIRPSLRNYRSLLSFGLYSTGTGLLVGLSERAPDLLLGRLINMEAAGLFSRGNGLVMLFRSALTNAVAPVVASSLAMLHRQDQDARTQLLRIFSYLTVVGYPLLSLLAILAYPIIVILFGRQWIPSVEVAQILCFGGALALVGNVCQTYLDATGAVRLNFTIRAISVPLFVLAIIAGATHSLEGAALGSALVGGVMTLLSLYLLGRKIQLAWRDIGQSVLPSVIVTACTALPTIGALTLLSSDQVWARCILGGTVALICWLVSLFLVRHHFRTELLLAVNQVTRKLRRA